MERIDHLVLTVRDPAATAAFYGRALGMRLVTFDTGRKALAFGRQKINLHEAGHELEPKARTPLPGSADFCLVAARPLDEIERHLAACGIAIEAGPVPRTGATGPIRSLYIRDPEGNLVEIASYDP
jgi:catechol 2,3-dioxygenase-like lactoylglutathione lyase family enzyme